MDENSEENLRRDKVNEILKRIEPEDDVPWSCDLVIPTGDIPFVRVQVTAFKSDCRAHISRIVSEDFEPVFRRFQEEHFVRDKITYYQRYFDLELDAASLQEFYLEMQAYMIHWRASLVLAYLKQHFKEFWGQATEGFIDEARLTIPDDIGSILELPEFGGKGPKQWRPLVKDINAKLIEPYRENVRKRLGVPKDTKPGSLKGMSLLNLLDGVVPLYRIYLKTLQDMKGADGKGLQERDAYLHKVANSPGRLSLLACEALIHEHPKVPYTSPESLHKDIEKTMKFEDEIVRVFKQRFSSEH